MSFFWKSFLKTVWLQKDCNTEQWLLAILEKWKRCVDGGVAFGALLKDLSKAFD